MFFSVLSSSKVNELFVTMVNRVDLFLNSFSISVSKLLICIVIRYTRQQNVTRSTKIQYAVSKRWESEQQSGQRKPQDWMSRIFCCCARQVGSMHFLCERKDGSPIVVAGPMWPLWLFVTVPIICVLGGFVLYFCMLQKKAPLVSFRYNA
jgi:hypothetical protein